MNKPVTPRSFVDDLVIQTLCDCEHELRERVAHLEADVHAYRELAQVAIAAVADLTAERDRLRGQLRQLRSEYSALRTQLLRKAAAA